MMRSTTSFETPSSYRPFSVAKNTNWQSGFLYQLAVGEFLGFGFSGVLIFSCGAAWAVLFWGNVKKQMVEIVINRVSRLIEKDFFCI